MKEGRRRHLTAWRRDAFGQLGRSGVEWSGLPCVRSCSATSSQLLYKLPATLQALSYKLLISCTHVTK